MLFGPCDPHQTTKLITLFFEGVFDDADMTVIRFLWAGLVVLNMLEQTAQRAKVTCAAPTEEEQAFIERTIVVNKFASPLVHT